MNIINVATVAVVV